ncbi:hypothetical protein D7S89_22160 [Trinickia fusca]|uniref:Uncharacterized protein n=2 Tax=Trinickia fusca TaxID=2419777 RepID=A0A494X8S4_9BURK|nr:hypothetical protein D7S89_22160 [Trinickia fusca]
MPRVIPVDNGINQVELHGQPAMVVRAWRENFNAHGFDVISMFVKETSGSGNGSWNIVPIFDREAGNPERLNFVAGGGADCQLRDFRLLTSAEGKSTQLVTATRDAGASFADPANVRFDYYELTENSDEVPGWPKLYFKWQKSVMAREQYCDVNIALDRELRLGLSSGSRIDGKE